ncbi:hypothetical protein ACFFKJ_28005 [Pelagicoccus mobilis]
MNERPTLTLTQFFVFSIMIPCSILFFSSLSHLLGSKSMSQELIQVSEEIPSGEAKKELLAISKKAERNSRFSMFMLVGAIAIMSIFTILALKWVKEKEKFANLSSGVDSTKLAAVLDLSDQLSKHLKELEEGRQL